MVFPAPLLMDRPTEQNFQRALGGMWRMQNSHDGDKLQKKENVIEIRWSVECIYPIGSGKCLLNKTAQRGSQSCSDKQKININFAQLEVNKLPDSDLLSLFILHFPFLLFTGDLQKIISNTQDFFSLTEIINLLSDFHFSQLFQFYLQKKEF